MLTLGAEIKPSKLTSKKDEKYHVQMSRYFVARGFYDPRHTTWLRKIDTHKKFYTGNQWSNSDDLSSFFLDVSGNPTTRIKMVFNVVRPMVEQYRGQAVRMDMNAQVFSIGTQAHYRKVQQLERLEFYDDLSRRMPSMAPALKERLPIGNSLQDTRENFDNIYVDDYVETMNNFLQNNLYINNAQSKQIRFAESLAYSGACIAFPYEYSGRWLFRNVQPENFFWDRNAREYDLSDAEYWGEQYDMDTAKVFEMFPNMEEWKKQAIEEFARNQQFASGYGVADRSSIKNVLSNSTMSGRTPVFYVFWVDSDKYEYGYIRDEYGNPALKRVDEKSKYSKKDLIPQAELSDKQKKVLDGKPTKKISCDSLRYCIFVPKENADMRLVREHFDADNDIVLDYGTVSYCEYDPFSPFNVEPPYKVNFWSYVDGQAHSPIEDVIDPQRLINRFISVAENRVNHSLAENLIYDKDAIGTEVGAEAEFIANIATGKPAGMRTRGRGTNNSVVPFQGSGMQSSNILLNIVGTLSGMTKATTGVNSELQGQASAGTDQLVGVTEMLIQRGALLQEPFYNAIAEVYMGLYNSCLNMGKHIYADHETELIDMVGEQGAQIIKITENLRNENFAAFIRRDAGNAVLKQSANQMLMTLVQMGIVKDEGFIAENLNKATPESLSIALRRSVKANQQFAKQQNEAETQLAQQAIAEQKNQQQSQAAMQKNLMIDQKVENEKNRQHEIDKIFAKSIADKAMGK